MLTISSPDGGIVGPGITAWSFDDAYGKTDFRAAHGAFAAGGVRAPRCALQREPQGPELLLHGPAVEATFSTCFSSAISQATAVPFIFSASSCSRWKPPAATTTLAPAAADAVAMCHPVPRDAEQPMTTAIFPFKLCVSSAPCGPPSDRSSN